MTSRVLEGRPLADRIKAEVRARVDVLAAAARRPGLRSVLIGDNPPSRVYARRLARLSDEVGIAFDVHHLPAAIGEEELDAELRRLNDDPDVDGVLVEMPLPEHLPQGLVPRRLDPRKDVDGITVHNAGRLYLGLPTHAPSTAVAMLELLRASGIDPRGQHAVIVGRSNIVGKPVALLLLRASATVTVTHSVTVDLPEHTRKADILMVAAGRPGLIHADMVKPGATVIDAGINVVNDGIVGDVDYDAVREVAGAITPVPGGVGPVTNVVLLRGVVESAEQRTR